MENAVSPSSRALTSARSMSIALATREIGRHGPTGATGGHHPAMRPRSDVRNQRRFWCDECGSPSRTRAPCRLEQRSERRKAQDQLVLTRDESGYVDVVRDEHVLRMQDVFAVEPHVGNGREPLEPQPNRCSRRQPGNGTDTTNRRCRDREAETRPTTPPRAAPRPRASRHHTESTTAGRLEVRGDERIQVAARERPIAVQRPCRSGADDVCACHRRSVGRGSAPYALSRAFMALSQAAAIVSSIGFESNRRRV